MSTPSWFRNTQESKDSIHNRLTHLEETVKKHLLLIRHNQAIMEKNLQDLKKKEEKDKLIQRPKIVSRKHLLEETFRESNDSIIRVVVDMAKKINPGVIPWFQQQINQYLQLPYIPSFQTQLTTLTPPHYSNYHKYNTYYNTSQNSRPAEDLSDDESF